jgi:cytochrome P450
VFSAEGEHWRLQRKLVMRAMTPEVVKHFFPTLVRMTERLRRLWCEAVAAGRPIDMPRDLKRFSMDVTSALAFGVDVDSLEHSDDRLQADVEHMFDVMCRRTAMPVPYWRYFKLPIDHRTDAAVARIRNAVAGFIANARKRLAGHPELRAKPSNMLDAMVAARDESGSGFTDDDLTGNVMTILVAGEDTTANTIAWLLYFLATHPDVAAKAVAEADAVLGDGPPDFAALDRLDYIEAAAMEAIRLKPVAPLLFLEANHPVEVGGVSVAAGTPVWGVMRRTALDEAHFPDAASFRPERWLHGDHVAGHDDPKRKVFGFGAGPRFCPGRYLAMVEIKMAVAMTARNFSLALDGDPAAVQEVFNFTMMPGSLPIRLQARTKA